MRKNKGVGSYVIIILIICVMLGVFDIVFFLGMRSAKAKNNVLIEQINEKENKLVETKQLADMIQADRVSYDAMVKRLESEKGKVAALQDELKKKDDYIAQLGGKTTVAEVKTKQAKKK